MTASTKTTDKKSGPEKVVIEVERTDDGIRLNLTGLEALRGLKDTLSPMCCCLPMSFCCKIPEKAGAETQPAG